MPETLLIIIAALLVPLIVHFANKKLRVNGLAALALTVIVVALLALFVVSLAPSSGFAAFLFDLFLIYAGSNFIYQVVHYVKGEKRSDGVK